jgi:hypothetical protein
VVRSSAESVERRECAVKIRRVVMAHDASGKAVFVGDEQVAPMISRGEREVHCLWGSDELPSLPSAGEEQEFQQFFPPVGGFRFVIFTDFPPGEPGLQDPEVLADGGGLRFTENAEFEDDDPGMHTTATLDLEVVLSGEIVLELDHGAEVVLRAGDTMIHHGERHRWTNRSTQPARVASFVVGVPHEGFAS